MRSVCTLLLIIAVVALPVVAVPPNTTMTVEPPVKINPSVPAGQTQLQ